MQLITAAIFAVILTFSNFGCLSQPMQGFVNPPPLCEPGIIEEMPPHIKKVCLALENSNQLSTALNAYIKNEAAGRIILQVVVFKFQIFN